MASKKTVRTYFNDKDDRLSDVGSARDFTDCSEGSSNASFKRNIKGTSKKHCIKGKNFTKSATIHQAQNTFENLNQIYHSPRTLPVSNKETVKNQRNIPKKLTSYSRAKKKIVPNKRTATPSYQKGESLAKGVRSKSSILESHMKSEEKSVAKCISLTDVRKEEKNDSVLSSPPSAVYLTPSRSLDFEKSMDSNLENSYFDYVKKFDLIRNSSLFNQWEKSLWSSQKGAAAKLSTSKPFLLKKKTYSCGILSINDSGVSSQKGKSDVKEDLNERLRYDSDDSEVFLSSEISDIYDYDCNSGNEASENKNVLKTSSSPLNVKKPVRVKYIDETTANTKELLIYPNDFLENLYKEKGSSASKTEIFESAIEQCMDYEGDSLRVIPDIEEFFRNLKRNNKPPADTKKAQVTKNDALEASKKRAIQPQRKVLSTPCWNKYQENAVKPEETKKPRNPAVLSLKNFVKFNRQKFSQKRNVNETGGFQPSETKRCSSSRDNTLDLRNEPKDLKDISIKSRDDKNEICGGSKSTTALKRINTEEIIASNFRYYFQFFGKLGGRLKSGVVISRMNSHFWLKKSGIIFDDQSLMIAEECFSAVAKRKLVLNISDYMMFLSAVARRQRMFFVDVIKRLMSINSQSVTKLPNELEASQTAGDCAAPSKPKISKQQGKMNNNVLKLSQKKV